MTAYSVFLAVPLGYEERANKLACALGYDEMPGRTYVVPLSADGAEPITHYGCHTWARQGFVETLAGAGQGVLPPLDWSQFGLTEQDVWDVLGVLISHVTPEGRPQDGVASSGLKIVQIDTLV